MVRPTKSAKAAAWLLALAVSVTAPAAAGAPASSSERLNVLLITIDTLRADHLSCYGYYRRTSPRIDALADDAIVFDRVVAPSSTTLPSHASLLTATYLEEHGILANVHPDRRPYVFPDKLKSIAGIYRERGWRTAAFVSAAPLRAVTGIGAGFETFREPPPDRSSLTADETVDEVVRWLERNALGGRGDGGADRTSADDGGSTTPVFVWVHLYDPHHPYDPPEPYRSRFKTDAALHALIDKRHALRGPFELRAEKMTHLAINEYDGEIAFVDDQVGRLLDWVRERGLWDRTAVVFTADHGEGLGQHGEIGHGCIHGEQLHVPLLIRVPGVEPRLVTHLMSLVDVVPTLLGLVFESPPRAFAEQATGVNVLTDGFAPRPVMSQRTARKRRGLHAFAHTLTTPRWKFVQETDGPHILYDLSEDPFELNDVARQQPRTAMRLSKHLAHELRRQRERGRSLREGSDDETAVDDELLEQLKSLGYVED